MNEDEFDYYPSAAKADSDGLYGEAIRSFMEYGIEYNDAEYAARILADVDGYRPRTAEEQAHITRIWQQVAPQLSREDVPVVAEMLAG